MQELFEDTLTGELPAERNDIAIERWIDRARVGAIAYMGLCGLAGMTFVLIELSSGQYAGAAIALFVTLAVCGLGVGALVGVRMARVIHANTKRMEKLTYRIDQLEAAFDAHEMDLQLVSPEPRDPSPLVGASLDHDRYPRLVADGSVGTSPAPPAPSAPSDDARPPAGEPAPAATSTGSVSSGAPAPSGNGEQPIQRCRRLWDELRNALEDKQIESWRRRLDQLNRDHACDLRARFGRLIRTGRYTEALEVGRQIVDLYPDSRMAGDFRTLESRIEELAFRDHPPRAEAN